jgi:hypothetical protein
MTELNQRVSVNVSVSDTVFALPSFSTTAIVAKHGIPGLSRVEVYTSLSAVVDIFGSFSPVGVAASIYFGQENTPDKLFVVERGSVETVAAALNDALTINSDFFFVASAERDNTSINALQDWAVANNRIPFFSSSDPTAPTVTQTDPFYYGSNLSLDSAGYFLKNAGSDIVATAINVVSTTATVSSVGHGANIGDIAYVWETAVNSLVGKYTITDVPDLDTFEFEVPLGTGSDAGGGIKILLNGQFIEMAALGKLSSTEPGKKTFDLQNFKLISPDKLTDTEKTFLASKDANYYTEIGGVALTSGLKENGYGGKLLSGRNIDLQWFISWLKSNIQIDLITVLVRAGGELGFEVDDLQKVESALESRARVSFENGAITTFPEGPFAGRDYVIGVPLVSEIDPNDRINSLLKGLTMNLFYKNKIKGFEIDVTISA